MSKKVTKKRASVLLRAAYRAHYGGHMSYEAVVILREVLAQHWSLSGLGDIKKSMNHLTRARCGKAGCGDHANEATILPSMQLVGLCSKHDEECRAAIEAQPEIDGALLTQEYLDADGAEIRKFHAPGAAKA